MKPIKLIIDGINSFSVKQEIDFTLLNFNLFCIYGKTGSGKTTILDSIILALYGECNRGGNLSDLVNLKREEALVSFEFKIGENLHRVVRRFKKEGVNTKAYYYLNEQLISSQVTEINKIIAQLIGLDKNDFTQVIALEQGQFDKFLKKTAKERTVTVSNLFKLNQYMGLSNKAGVKISQLNSKIQSLEKYLSAFNLCTKENIISLKKSLEELNSFKEKNEKQIEQLSIRQQQLIELKNLTVLIQRVKRDSNSLNTEIEQLKNKLSQTDQIIINYKSALNEYQQSDKILREQSAKIRQDYENELVDKAVGIISQRLNIGDKCPICDTQVTKINKNSKAFIITREQVIAKENQVKEMQEKINKINSLIAINCEKSNSISKEILSKKEKLDVNNKELEDLIERTKKSGFNENEYIEIEKNLAHIKSIQQSTLIRIGETSINLRSYQEGLEKKQQAERERQELVKQSDSLSLLKKLFVGEKFLEFISEEYVAMFTLSASKILNKISNGKYSLIYDKKTQKFYVLDFFNGNQKRKISTLSGGETFLASLALSVAISGQISKSNLDLFFLDEGFGTLDGEKIESVTEALNQLSQLALVGVISHRTELIERISSKIFVTTDEESGSTIEII